MNYLAHAYLSMKKSGVVTGNMISDFVKGKKQYDLPSRVQTGIKLHRSIDEFTDRHESTRIIKTFFRPAYGLYAGAFADVVYDHWLANDRSVFPDQNAIDLLTIHTCSDLEQHLDHLPPSFLPVFDSMREHNWLGLYGHDWAVKRSFEGLVRRSRYMTESDTAFQIFLENKDSMKSAYDHFFPSLLSFNNSLLEKILPE